MISGKNYFTNVGDRWEMPNSGLSMKKKPVNRMIPFNTELLGFSRQKLRIDEETGTREFDRARTSALMGFAFLLRAVELAALEFRDVTFGGMRERGTPAYS